MMLRSEIEDLFSELSNAEIGSEFQATFDRERARAEYAQQYDAERAKWIRCVPELMRRRKESQSAYEKRKWQKTRADEQQRAAHNAKRRAAHARLKSDPKRLAEAKRKQARHSANYSLRKRKANQ